MVVARLLLVSLLVSVACFDPESDTSARRDDRSAAGLIAKRCEDFATPRVISVGENLFVAVGYDLANVVLLKTKAGNVIFDTGMSRARATEMKKALLVMSPGPIAAVVLTHSHIDHVGGVGVWLEEGTQIWATAAFTENFYRQYGLLRKARARRGATMLGWQSSDEELPCSSIGRRIDLEAAIDSVARVPTHVFESEVELKFGEHRIQLHSAPGETEDQLYAYLPEERALLPGDNFYASFPNLYSIRGSESRPVAEWIASLDRMRRHDAQVMIPAHTLPVQGQGVVRQTLRDYRDAIQFVHDQTVKSINAGLSLDEIVAGVKLPAHLAARPYLAELYGRVEWSVRGIYSNYMGWFSGHAAELYELPQEELARRQLSLMGGQESVLGKAEEALRSGEIQWAIYLAALVDRVESGKRSRAILASGYRALGGKVENTNGRTYLIESALQLERGTPEIRWGVPSRELASRVPLAQVFQILSTRIKPGVGAEAETVEYFFSDLNQSVFVTVRNGIAEVVEGELLPGAPSPVARLTLDSDTFKFIAVKIMSPVSAFAKGLVKVDNKVAYLKFSRNFEM